MTAEGYGVRGMEENYELSDYWDWIWQVPLEERTPKQIECSLKASVALEIADHGYSGFDVMYERNHDIFPAIAAIRKECVKRGLCMEKEFDRYIVGVCDAGRICNRFTLLEWFDCCAFERRNHGKGD